MTALLTSARVRLAAGALTLIAVGVTVSASGGVHPADVERAVAAAGAAAPVVFVAVYAALTVLMFPGAVGSVAAGALFGIVAGTALTVVGATLGATASFYVGRRLGRACVEEISGHRLRRADKWLERHGFLAVLYSRLIPVLPFNILNYAGGVSGVRARDYVLATAVGIVPGSFAYVALGSSIGHPLSVAFIAGIALIGLLVAAGPLLARRFPVRLPADEESAGPAA